MLGNYRPVKFLKSDMEPFIAACVHFSSEKSDNLMQNCKILQALFVFILIKQMDWDRQQRVYQEH